MKKRYFYDTHYLEREIKGQGKSFIPCQNEREKKKKTVTLKPNARITNSSASTGSKSDP
jgi:hypothetical protein